MYDNKEELEKMEAKMMEDLGLTEEEIMDPKYDYLDE